jgi:hypothetical protein
MLKNQLLNLYASIMNVKQTSNYLRYLYAGIAMEVKKLGTIYETYMQVL